MQSQSSQVMTQKISQGCGVANYYCEITFPYSPLAPQPGVYCFDADFMTRRDCTPYTDCADKVWREESDVRWIKNRYQYPQSDSLTDDELKEFVWIKLQAIQLA